MPAVPDLSYTKDLPRWKPHRQTATAFLVWTVLVAGGLHFLLTYEGKPGDLGSPPSAWPKESVVAAPAGKPVLILFAHPLCPCTKASLTQLADVMARAKEPLDAYVVFLVPEGADEDWREGELWEMAQGIPGLQSIADENGRETEHFGAVTSGHALLFDGNGGLLFSGGITAARGHEGRNPASETLLALMNRSTAERAGAAVFGCAFTSAAGTRP